MAAFTGTLVVVTAYLVHYTKKLWGSTEKLVYRTEETTKTIERAYVQLSHASPGIVGGVMSGGNCRVSVGVKNHGTTPARITRIFLTKRVLSGELPDFPDYQSDPGELPEQPMEAFLMKDAEIFVGFQFLIDIADVQLISDRKKQLVVYGFVDYTDQFGRDFRGGYARNWVPNLLPNNLVFTPHPHYNYDSER